MPSNRHVASIVLGALAALLLAALAVGCTATADSELPPEAEVNCQPRTCDIGACGTVADGCGGQLSCGSCEGNPEECQPLSCDDNSCGVQGDGCGGELQCGECGSGTCENGVCLCGDDAHEPSDSEASAYDFGDHKESSNYVEWVGDLVMTGSEEDWFVVSARDSYSFGNPRVGFGVRSPQAGHALTLVVRYECHNGAADIRDCRGGSYDADLDACVATIAAGSAETWLHLQANCSGGDETGTAYAVVGPLCAEGECAAVCDPYEVGVEVTK